jgi:hypothetical protein
MTELTEDRARLIVWEEINDHYVDVKSCKERHEREEKMIDELKIVAERQSRKLDKIIILLIAGCIGLIFDLVFRFIIK